MMTITITVETPEEAAKVVALVGGKEATIQAPAPEAPKGRIGFARRGPGTKIYLMGDAEIVPDSFRQRCCGDGE